jgi:acetylglutamate kinase
MSTTMRLIARLLKFPHAAYWIEQHAKAQPGRFAVIKASGKIISDDENLAALASSLATQYHLELYPSVCVGFGERATRLMEKHGIESKFHESSGVRITPCEGMPYIEQASREYCGRLVRVLKSMHVTAKICDDVFKAKRKQLSGVRNDHYTGEVIGVDTASIERCVEDGIIPIVSPLGRNRTGQAYNVNADEAAKALAVCLMPEKYVALSDKQGVLDREGKTISIIEVSEIDGLIADGTITGGMIPKVTEARDLILRSNGRLIVQIAMVKDLNYELFSDGAGTKIYKNS